MESIIEVSAKSPGEARLQLRTRAPKGLDLLEETILSDGSPLSVTASAETVVEAMLEAQAMDGGSLI